MACLVREKLYIGDITAATEILTLKSPKITHILSLLTSGSVSTLETQSKNVKNVYVGEVDDYVKRCLPKERLLYKLEKVGADLGIKRMVVDLRDVEEENLLDILDVCFDFMDEGMTEDGGGVLVHCFAGVSRSAAIITGYLMRTEQKSQEDALKSLREIRESVCPNEGFIEQLKLFEDMGFKVDTSSPLYKRFRLKALGNSYGQGEKMDSSMFEIDPGLSPNQNSCENKPKTVYRCKKCRRILAVQENIVSHAPGEGESCFHWPKRKGGNPHNQIGELCTSLFIEPLKWMTTVEEGGVNGKLSCPKCDARLGYFDWSGSQCSCGSWITPAFQIHKNKIDGSTEMSS